MTEERRNALRKIMVQAWRVFRTVKCTFAKALKFAWKIARKELALREEWHRFEDTDIVRFNIWQGYGHVRAYYTRSWVSKYQDSKKNNFVEM